MNDKIEKGNYVAVICRVIENDVGPYPHMHLVQPISDDEVDFTTCEVAMLGKVEFSKEAGYNLLTDNSEFIQVQRKLETVKKIVDDWGGQRSDPHGLEYDWHYKDKYFALRDALNNSDSEGTSIE